MARACQICQKKIAFWDVDYKTQGMSMHYECREEFLREPEDDAGKQKNKAEPKEEKSKGIETEEDKQPGPWSVAKSITSGDPQGSYLSEPSKSEKIAELTEKEKEDVVGWLPKNMKPLLTMQRELASLPDIQNISTNTDSKSSDFTSKAGYALSLGLKEKEIFFFGGMQWLTVAIAYLLWTQMLFWIPPETWEAVSDQDSAGAIDLALIAWAFVCVGVAAFPIGIFSSCMGVTHFLHKQGRGSTIAMCLKLSLPNAWPLWAFHWTDGWVTVRQIMSRLPRDNDRRTLGQKLFQEALYNAWKVGIAGVLPSMVLGRSMIDSGKESLAFVKQHTKEIVKLRAAYSGYCWILGILAYMAGIPLMMYLDVGRNSLGDTIASFYFYMGIPICFTLGIIMFFLRPIYILTMCNLYSDYLKANNQTVELPDNPPRAMSALVVFAILCIAVLVVFYFREAIGLVDILSTV